MGLLLQLCDASEWSKAVAYLSKPTTLVRSQQGSRRRRSIATVARSRNSGTPAFRSCVVATLNAPDDLLSPLESSKGFLAELPRPSA